MDAFELSSDDDISSVLDFEESDQPMVLSIYNVLASADLGINIDLSWFTENFGNTYYEPQEFPAARADVHDRHTENVVTVSTFSNGKIQATGGSSIECTKNSLKKVAKRLRDRGFQKAKLLNFEVHNIQAVMDSGFPVDLRLLREIYVFVDYEPERSPGLRIRIPVIYLSDHDCSPEYLQKMLLAHQYGTTVQSKELSQRAKSTMNSRSGKIEVVTLTIHFSGKVGMAGARSIQSLENVIDFIRPYILRSRMI